jgi:anti-anti-sigma factor
MSASPERVATSFDFPEGMGRCQVQLTSTSVGQIAVLRVTGEVDALSIGILSVALGNCLAQRPVHLVVDLTGLRFCSGRGLTLLVETGWAAAAVGVGYSLAGCGALHDRLMLSLWRNRAPRRYRDTAEAIDEAVLGLGDTLPHPRAERDPA